MKKLYNIILLFLGSIIFYGNINAASISIEHGAPYVYGEKTDDELIFWITKIQNLTDKKVELKLKYEFIHLTPGHSAGVCFDNNCYKATTTDWLSPEIVTLEPNEAKTGTGNSFHCYPFNLDLGNEPVDGVDTIKFTLFNIADPNDFASVTVAYQVGTTSVEDNDLPGFSITDIFPNPAKENVTIKYDMPEQTGGDPYLEIFNAMGDRIIIKNLCDCKDALDLDLNKYNSGTYFVNLMVNGKKTAARNFVITK